MVHHILPWLGHGLGLLGLISDREAVSRAIPRTLDLSLMVMLDVVRVAYRAATSLGSSNGSCILLGGCQGRQFIQTIHLDLLM